MKKLTENQKLAKRIARDLFTNAIRERGDLITLLSAHTPRRDLGGWCESAMANRIAMILGRKPRKTTTTKGEPNG